MEAAESVSVSILRPGLLATIQDGGRYGFQRHGVSVSGAMDQFALLVANLLVGNNKGAAALETTLGGLALALQQDCLIAICGGDLGATISGNLVPMWRPVYVRAGSVLEFRRCVSGCRAMITMAGGFDVPQVLGSRSTYLRAKIGGFDGRALKPGDVLRCAQPSAEAERRARQLATHIGSGAFAATKWFVSTGMLSAYSASPAVRATPGAHFEQFTSDSRREFFDNAFEVTAQSDRMGYRLRGPALQLAKKLELTSAAVANGTVQVPPDGHPIVLLADRQTTGGYPVIAHIASVDLPIIAQAKPGDSIRFEPVTLEQAQQLLWQRETWLRVLKQAIRLQDA